MTCLSSCWKMMTKIAFFFYCFTIEKLFIHLESELIGKALVPSLVLLLSSN